MSSRWLSLDVFRAIAVLLMIQGHTFTALLHPLTYEGSWVAWHTLVHGLTAPMFLLGGGIAYGLVTLADAWDARPAGASMRLVRRGLLLLVVGYFLQLPSASLAQIIARRDLWVSIVKVGPLQLVGACLLCCEAIRFTTRTRAGFVWTVAGVSAGISLCAPFVWKAHASSRLWLPVGTWFDGYAGSVFPFFPWAGFFFFGVLLSVPARWATQDGALRGRRERWFALAFLLGGSACAWLAYDLFLRGLVMRTLYGAHELWHTSPLYVLFRAGLVVASLGMLWLLEPLTRRLYEKLPVLERLLGTLSRRSLVAYVTHLYLLYGTPFTLGLVKMGRALSLVEGIVAALATLCATTILVLLWDRYIASVPVAAWLRASAERLLGHRSPEVHRVGERKRLDIAPSE